MARPSVASRSLRLWAIAVLGPAAAISGCTSSATPADPAEPAAVTQSASIVVVASESPAATISPSPSATVSPTETPSPSLSPSPSRSPSPSPAPKAKPPATAVPIATPRPLPNITGTAPVVTPASPTCGNKFVVDVEVGNKGLGAMPGPALAIIGIARVEVGGNRIMFKDSLTIPALAGGTSVHLRETRILNTSGHFQVTAFLDSSLWIAESRETDNEVASTFDILFGPGCSKI